LPSGAAATQPDRRKLSQERDSEFFRWFHLAPTGVSSPGDNGQWIAFRPESAEFGPLVEVAALTDPDGVIHAARLSVARSFIDGHNAPFARDIVKSFLTWAAPAPQAKALALLIAHFEDPRLGARGTILLGPNAPNTPAEPDRTGALDVYLGQRDEADITVGPLRLRFSNGGPSDQRRFRIDADGL
jgi:hypothetical protein